jgi:hypothetical protein
MTSAWRSPKRSLTVCLLFAAAAPVPHPAVGRGDEGHEIVAIIAERYLEPAAPARVAALLAADTDTLTDRSSLKEARSSDCRWPRKYFARFGIRLPSPLMRTHLNRYPDFTESGKRRILSANGLRSPARNRRL